MAVPAEQSTFTAVESSKRQALGMIRSEALLHDRVALDAITAGVWLSEREPDDHEELSNILEKIQLELPLGIRDDSMLTEEDGRTILRIVGGTIIGLLPMRGGGEDWVVAVTATVIGDEGTDELGAAVTDAVNARVPGMLFVNTHGYAAFLGAVPGRVERLDREWAGLVGAVALENHARGKQFATELAGLSLRDDVVVRYWLAERSLADDQDERAGHHDIVDAMKRYVATTPVATRPLLRVRQREESTQLELPYPRRGGTDRLVLSGRYIGADSGLDWAPAGYHYFHEIPEELAREDALRICASLNGMGRELTENNPVTTPWLLGSWQTAPGAEGWRILYHGYVPTTLRPRVDLVHVTSGIVREIWQGRRKLETILTFERTVHEEDLEEL